MSKSHKSNKRDILVIFSIILLVLAIFMALISTSKITANEEKLLEYKENSYIDYEINEDKKIVSINFKYNFLTSRKISFDYDYDITASIIAINKETDKNVYYNQVVLIPSKKIGEVNTAAYAITEVLNVNYEDYNKIIKEKLNKQDLSKINAYMEISLNTNTISDSFNNRLQNKSSSLLKIPLLTDDINVTKQELNETKSLLGIKDELIKNKKLFVLAIIMTSLSIIIFIGAFILYLINPQNSYNKEYKNVSKMIREYDELIEVVFALPNLKNKKIIEVSEIKDFITLRDKYELAITLVSLKNNLYFLMFKENRVWKYFIEMK